MTDCAVALIAVEPSIVSFLFKALFLSTNATNFLSVLDALMQCELWLKQICADNNTLGIAVCSFFVFRNTTVL